MSTFSFPIIFPLIGIGAHAKVKGRWFWQKERRNIDLGTESEWLFGGTIAEKDVEDKLH